MGKPKDFLEEKERPTNALQLTIACKSGLFTGFLKICHDRPKKSSSPAIVNHAISPPDLNYSDPASTKVSPTQPTLKMARSAAGCPTSRPHYKDWKAPENARALAITFNDRLASEYPNKVTGEIIVPLGSLNCAT